MRITQRFCGLTAAVCLAMTATACGGDGGEEAVFLYFINGYPGTGEVSVNSDVGTIASGMRFGERFGDPGSCGPDTSCLPYRIERQRGTDFTFLLENMTEPAEVGKELFSMYPHETGTIVLTRRSGETGVDTTLLRHTQSISSDCTISFINGLSLSNEFVGAFASFSITPEVFEEDIRIAGFTEESTTPFVSECGTLPVGEGDHNALQRPQVLEAIRQNPWFLLSCEGEIGDSTSEGSTLPGCSLAWGVPNVDGRARINQGGAFTSVLNSREYFECIQAGISIRQEEGTMAMPGFPLPEPDCPPGDITWDDVDVDFQVVQMCNQPITRNATMIDPGQSDFVQSFQGQYTCEMNFRIRNEGPDIVFGPDGGDDLGSHGDGAPIETQLDIPNGSQHFYVLLGRPVNPIVWQWDSSDTFVDLSSFPYFNPNGDRPQIGDYD